MILRSLAFVAGLSWQMLAMECLIMSTHSGENRRRAKPQPAPHGLDMHGDAHDAYWTRNDWTLPAKLLGKAPEAGSQTLHLQYGIFVYIDPFQPTPTDQQLCRAWSVCGFSGPQNERLEHGQTMVYAQAPVLMPPSTACRHQGPLLGLLDQVGLVLLIAGVVIFLGICIKIRLIGQM